MEETAYKHPSKGVFFIHLAIYLIAMAILWTHYYVSNKALHGGAYPWEAWFTGSWFIFVLGHFCNTFFDSNRNNSDKGYVKYLQEREG
ncbi:2TM domain-containing protein [Compostibacter hankyongensis]|uniref:2TM domain-containing protein n=1 Tax=Compostibacter hankyongensis TaxID=1007089 RepID=A0ABP8FG15_9BACT